MSDDEESKGILSCVLNPSACCSSLYTAFGFWGFILGILNILGMAHPTLKVAWAGYLTMGLLGDGLVSNMDFHPVSDTVFLAGTGTILALGLRGLAETEAGIAGWFKGLFVNDTWTALVNTDAGWQRTLGAWCMAIGLIFYISWGICYTGWVDVGVYSVAMAFFAFGYAMKASGDVEGSEIPKE